MKTLLPLLFLTLMNSTAGAKTAPEDFAYGYRIARITELLNDLTERGDVTFEEMHPSMARLPSQDHSALAFAEVLSAVKYIYASTFFRGARAYLQSIGGSPGDERMAVILQAVVGRRIGERSGW